MEMFPPETAIRVYRQVGIPFRAAGFYEAAPAHAHSDPHTAADC